MKHRLLDNSDLLVAELALGTMTFDEDLGWGARRVSHDLGGDPTARRLAREFDPSPQTQTAHESVERQFFAALTLVRASSSKPMSIHLFTSIQLGRSLLARS
jgi:hypothetical protein